MLVWETDPSLRSDEARTAFAEVWCALPKIIFSRTLHSVQGNARLADGSVAEELSDALKTTDKPVSIGGAELAAEAVGLGLVDEFRIFRKPDRRRWRHPLSATGHPGASGLSWSRPGRSARA